MAPQSQSGLPSEPNSSTTAPRTGSVTPELDKSNQPSHPVNSDTPSSQPARSNSVSASHLNPRSCVTCRRRKVRCNKENPCSNWLEPLPASSLLSTDLEYSVRAGIDCIFPGPGRAPRKSRKPPDAELLARLKKLEGVVTRLGAQVDENGVLHNGKKDELPQQFHSNSPDSQTGDSHKPSIDKHLGRLVINEDRSRYVSNQFWASMGDEVPRATG